ncbi:MAG: MBL fold metallo-hydrolase [Nitrospirota bacterium]|nr:MAG: MBL fold metallo-hydrolase [Nitrospirota bacterium]
MSIELSFHGGVDTVTGSCHLIKAGGLNVLIDCGMFQGTDGWEDRNYESFSFDPSSIDFLLLTHGHLDHCGRIPLLVKAGFNGSIICTSATYDIAKIILMDSARIHEEDYAHWKKIWKRRGEKERKPLYTILDVMDTLRLFDDFARYGVKRDLNQIVSVTFKDAGHILGASFIEIDIKKEKRLIFSGDLGNRNKPIIRDPFMPESAEIIVVESTYSDREHKDFGHTVDEFAGIISQTCKRGGNTLIPSFAIERAQDLLYILRKLTDEGRIPPCRVFLDSPMGINVTGVMRRHPECFDDETSALFSNNEDPFWFPGLEFTLTPEESKQINFVKSNAIIIAGSGMCTGGRIKHHLKHNIWRPEASVVFVGFQAEGTLGRHIVDGKATVKIYRENYNVRASVHTVGGFSSHADRSILLDWLGNSKGTEKIFLVHGESEKMSNFKKAIMDRQLAGEVIAPHYEDHFEL